MPAQSFGCVLACMVNQHHQTTNKRLQRLGSSDNLPHAFAVVLIRTRRGAWLAQGNVLLEQLEDHLHLDLHAEEGSVSLGGYFQEQLGRILRPGDELRIQGWQIRVLSMRGLAPGQLLLRPMTREGDDAGTP